MSHTAGPAGACGDGEAVAVPVPVLLAWWCCLSQGLLQSRARTRDQNQPGNAFVRQEPQLQNGAHLHPPQYSFPLSQRSALVARLLARLEGALLVL